MFSTPSPAPIRELYVFGDSLSDTGTVFRATGGLYPPNPPYFQGRYSNGRVWVEYLADRLQLTPSQTHNFACGGATTASMSSLSDTNGSVPGLLVQLQMFAQAHRRANAMALYILWAGANDYLQGASSAVAPVENITKAIASLANLGAKRILVANLPDLGKLPATRDQTNAATLSALSQAHNQALRRSLKVMGQQYTELQVLTLDANTLYHQAITQPTSFGLANVASACLSNAGICSYPDQFLFWDGIHPTTVAHRILGEAAFAAIETGGMVKPRSVAHP